MSEKFKKSAYIHIPFCNSKCYYCNFVSYTDKSNYKEQYINSLAVEIINNLQLFENIELSTLYLGGGTPSLISVELYRLLFDKIKAYSVFLDSSEITIEVNPGTVNFEYLCKLRELGINRLSIGVQTFDDNILKLLNRKHTVEDAINIVKIAKKAGFENISIDLIYGLPSQDLNSWNNTLNRAMDLDIQHISAYGLKIEEGTVFAKNKNLNIPSEEYCAQIYLKTIDFLQKNGYNHYEISNFAKKGFESKHNITYWKNEDYFGFGVAAHGYIDGIRYSNSSCIDEYLANPIIRESKHSVSPKERVEEAIFLGLRLTEGLDIKAFKDKYSVDLLYKYRHVINKYRDFQLLELDDSFLKLTTQGMLLSNDVLSEFLE